MYLGTVLDARNEIDLALSQVPAVLAILAYYAILEGRFGCGVGKAVLNLRVIGQTETAPGIRRAFLRAAIFLLPAQIANMVLGFIALAATGRAASATESVLAPILAIASVAFGFGILAAMFSTARRRNGYAGLHDLATKTRVVLRPRAVEARRSASRTMAADSDVAAGGDRLGPYVVAASTTGTPVSVPAVVQGYDDRLRRRVWVEILPARSTRAGAISAAPRARAGSVDAAPARSAGTRTRHSTAGRSWTPSPGPSRGRACGTGSRICRMRSRPA
jgi:eukaryotic-like serine/threonine-protein kinase